MASNVKMALKDLRHMRKECRHELHKEVSRLEREINKVRVVFGAKVSEYDDKIKRVEAGEEVEIAPAPAAPLPDQAAPSVTVQPAPPTKLPLRGSLFTEAAIRAAGGFVTHAA